jgi:hypothetical protein
MMRTVTFDQAQRAYDNMTPCDDGLNGDEFQDQFDELFFAGQLVMTEDGTGIVTGYHEGEFQEDCDGESVWCDPVLTRVEVAVPFEGTNMYRPHLIKVRKGGEWVDAE